MHQDGNLYLFEKLSFDNFTWQTPPAEMKKLGIIPIIELDQINVIDRDQYRSIDSHSKRRWHNFMIAKSCNYTNIIFIAIEDIRQIANMNDISMLINTDISYTTR